MGKRSLGPACGPLLTSIKRTDDTEYCVLPLSNDTAVNPFRIRVEAWKTSPLLSHAVLALCYQHLEHAKEGKWEHRATEHREEAARLLETASSPDSPPGVRDLSLLDSILVMFTLDVSLVSRYDTN